MARQFGWNISVLGIYNVSDSTLLGSYLTSFRDCRLRGETLDYDGTAINEIGDYPIPYREKWAIELGALVDTDAPDLLQIYGVTGWGPYLAYIVRSDGKHYLAQVIISTVDLIISDGPITQSATLKVQGGIDLVTTLS